MTTADARRFHQEAWTRLYDLIIMRNKLLQRLGIMAGRAVSTAPTSSMVFEFETTQGTRHPGEDRRAYPAHRRGHE